MDNRIAVLYGPVGGSTEKVANLIKQKLGEDKCVLIPVSKVNEYDLQLFTKFILGISTVGTHNWSHDNVRADWDHYLPTFRDVNFANKKVAIYGLGNQVAYSNHFVDEMRTLYDIVIQQSGQVIGAWPTTEYDFNESAAVINNEFIGLAIDEDHQSEFTLERVNKWIDQIIPIY